ncbi:MAG: histidinol-phosphate transaminase, partial [Pseudomonadota bacterium]
LAPPPDADQVVQAALDQNESAWPPSPAAVAAATHAVTNGHLYPDADANILRAAISSTHGIAAERIVCSAGSMELISALVCTYAGRGDEVLSSDYAYAFFRAATALNGATYVAAPERNFHVDVDALLDAVTEKTRLVFVANPGNPTGTHLPSRELMRLRAALPADCLLVIDEAYGEFAQDTALENAKLGAREDVVILRTFSKAYGLAGLRVGWSVFPPSVAVEIRKALNPSNLTAPGQAAAAAAVRDQAYMRNVVAETAVQRAAFIMRLQDCGLSVSDSHTNFVLVDLGDEPSAVRINAALRDVGIFCRPMGLYGLPAHLRITIGTASAMAQTADRLARHVRAEENR